MARALRSSPRAPPVQGYKFNIFYPDLIDKSKAPTYSVRLLSVPGLRRRRRCRSRPESRPAPTAASCLPAAGRARRWAGAAAAGALQGPPTSWPAPPQLAAAPTGGEGPRQRGRLHLHPALPCGAALRGHCLPHCKQGVVRRRRRRPPPNSTYKYLHHHQAPLRPHPMPLNCCQGVQPQARLQKRV